MPVQLYQPIPQVYKSHRPGYLVLSGAKMPGSQVPKFLQEEKIKKELRETKFFKNQKEKIVLKSNENKDLET